MSIKFYFAWYCPFAQRAWMALLLKQADFEYLEVDPYHKSAWWRHISRGHNTVPVLVVDPGKSGDESTIVDSTRVVEYLEDRYPARSALLPANAEDRAEVRYWVDHINQYIVPYVYRFLEAREPGKYRDESRATLVDGIQRLFNSQMTDKPYLGGQQIGMLDVLLIPFAYRIDALLGYYRDFALPEQGDVWQGYKRWYDNMAHHAAFIQSQTYAEDYRQRLIDHYRPYSMGKGQTNLTKVD